MSLQVVATNKNMSFKVALPILASVPLTSASLTEVSYLIISYFISLSEKQKYVYFFFLLLLYLKLQGHLLLSWIVNVKPLVFLVKLEQHLL